MFGIDFYARDEIVRFALQEIAQNLIQRAEAGFGEAGDRFMDHTEYVQTFRDHASGHSLLFGAGQDRFALRIDRLPEGG